MVGNHPRSILKQGPARLLQLLRQPVAALKLHGDHSPIVQVLGAKRTSDGAGGGDPHLNLARRRLHELFLRGRSFLALGPLAALAFRGGRFAGLGRRSGGGLGRGLGSHLRLKLLAQLGQQLFGPLHRGHDLDAISIVDELPKLQRSRAENQGRLRVPDQGDTQRRADGIQDLLLLLGVGAGLGDAAEGLRRCGADLLGACRAWCGGWRLLPLLVLCNLGRLLLGSLPGLLCLSRLLGDEQPSTRLRTRLL
mmetsp:Transcript_95038/g.306061  ORF Transcript_95038/g.306061 Transcript_95038/m.306061 type:complete len:251 (-) Transcript_95038:195-947(-)